MVMAGTDVRGYDVPHQLVEQLYRDTGVRTNPLRGIGVTANKFATEAFMDEVARKRGVDPLAFRLELLKGTPRAYKAVERVAQMADWGRKRDGRALGLAYIDYSGSQVAGIAEVSLDRASGQIKVHNFWCTIDCGVAVQPDNVIAQTESSIVYGLGMTLSERISIKDGAVEQSNFYDYYAAADERRAGDAHRVDPDRQPSDRRGTDGDAADRAGGLECDHAADRRAAAAHAVHAGAGEEGAGIDRDQPAAIIEPGRPWRPGAVWTVVLLTLCGEAADFDRRAEAVAAGFAQPSVADAAFVHEGGALRHELLVTALRADRPREITDKREHCGRSIQLRHARPPWFVRTWFKNHAFPP